MSKTNTTTNMLGRLIECTDGAARLAASMANDTDRAPLPIVLLWRHSPCAVVGRCREEGRTWLDVATPDGIATVMAEQVRLAPDPEVALRLAQVAASTDPDKA